MKCARLHQPTPRKKRSFASDSPVSLPQSETKDGPAGPAGPPARCRRLLWHQNRWDFIRE